MLVKLHLLVKGYEVEMAYNFKDGMEILNSYHPDIVFLDNNLPDGQGWEQVTEIAAKNPYLRINLITGDMPDMKDIATDVNLYIMMKPLSKTEIDQSLTFANTN